MTFSQRMGIAPVRERIQVESLDEDTRNAIWNLLSPFLKAAALIARSTVHLDIWTELYHKTVDTVPRDGSRFYDNRTAQDLYYKFFRDKVINGSWNECLDLVEFMAAEWNQELWNAQCYDPMFHDQRARAPSSKDFNFVLSQYMVGYRFVGNELTPITNENEIDSIENAVENSKPAVKEQLSKALAFLSDRKRPDYAKSVQCSISAVEAQCNIILGGKPTSLGVALKELEKRGVKLHSALKGGFEKLYGFTSNADGIRHAGINASDVDQALAKFMLVACSAFVNYLIEKE